MNLQLLIIWKGNANNDDEYIQEWKTGTERKKIIIERIQQKSRKTKYTHITALN